MAIIEIYIFSQSKRVYVSGSKSSISQFINSRELNITCKVFM
ncbi:MULTISPECIES: hypothetical protein [unclassified Butyrivibrio]|nr:MULTISPECIES: hypothetical protein [unclassified Butyrivibrio]MDC7292350.1 hypothetical protein [Butyrivibrio sp. DSM 10294]